MGKCNALVSTMCKSVLFIKMKNEKGTYSMKTILRTIATPAVIFVCIWVTGCASFPKHRVPETGQLPPPADASQALQASYQFTLETDIGEKYLQNIRQQFEKEFVDVLKKSGYFAMLSPGQEGRIHIEADMLNYKDVVADAVGILIGGLSLCTIPIWVTDNYKVTVKVTTSEGKQAEYVLDDAMTTVIWLPMIVATPFKSPIKVSTDVRKNMYRNLILKMQEDGLLPPAKKGQQTSRLQVTFEIEPAA